MNHAKRIPLATFISHTVKKRRAKKIVIHCAECIELITPSEILYLRAEGNYCVFVLRNRREILTSKTLGSFEEILSKYGFIRPHQSFIVNENEVYQITKNPSQLILAGGKKIPISRSNRKIIIELLTSKF